jgi:tRNA threonylcarbamoyladenosine biosynthesis protein TsaE
VISPSFVLIRAHLKARLPLYHFDLYRLKSPRDIAALGYEEYLYAEGVTVIEWADRLKGLLPEKYLKIEISIKENSRLFNFSAIGSRYHALLRSLERRLC